MLLTVDEIPPVAHLEDIGTLVEAVPHHVHKLSVARPALQAVGEKLCQGSFVVGCRRYDHVPLAVVAFEDKGVAEVITAVAIVAATEEERAALGPGLEIGRGSHHHGLTAVVSSWLVFVAGIEGIIHSVGIVVHRRARS